MAGETCIEDLEHRCNDEALLDLLGAARLPGPTTAGDFCRRFGSRASIDLVVERELYNLPLCEEEVAEFGYRPGACNTAYRMVALRKVIAHERGQGLLFHETCYLFYITHKLGVRAEEIVEMANKRCNQERTIGELKSGVSALSMSLGGKRPVNPSRIE